MLAVFQDDGVLADKVDAADVAVQVHPDQRPVQARGHLLDMGRLAGAVIALHHDTAIKGEARQDGARGLRIELIGWVQIRHVAVAICEGGNLHVDVDAEGRAHVDLPVRGERDELVFG